MSDCALYGNPGATYSQANAWDPEVAGRRDRPSSLAYSNAQLSYRPPPPPTGAELAEELRELERLQRDERPGALGEILAQEEIFHDVFFDRLGLGGKSYPLTKALVDNVLDVSDWWTLRLKQQLDRARPVHLLPALAPPFCPGHPSYPSGHGGQSHAVALALKLATPSAWHPLLEETSKRIGKLREIAGVHYRSDTRRGRELAEALIADLLGQATGFDLDVANSRNELARLLGSP